MNVQDDPQALSMLKGLIATADRVKAAGGDPTDPSIQIKLEALRKRVKALGIKTRSSTGREIRTNYNENHDPNNGEFAGSGVVGRTVRGTVTAVPKAVIGAAATGAALEPAMLLGAVAGSHLGEKYGEAAQRAYNAITPAAERVSVGAGYDTGAILGIGIGAKAGFYGALGVGGLATLSWIANGYRK